MIKSGEKEEKKMAYIYAVETSAQNRPVIQCDLTAVACFITLHVLSGACGSLPCYLIRKKKFHPIAHWSSQPD